MNNYDWYDSAAELGKDLTRREPHPLDIFAAIGFVIFSFAWAFGEGPWWSWFLIPASLIWSAGVAIYFIQEG